MAIIINAIEREAGRAYSDIGEENCEVVPAFANSDAASAIILPSSMVGIDATLTHVLPNSVERVKLPIPRKAMGELLFFAAAGTGIAAAKILPTNNGGSPAVTTAAPSNTPAASRTCGFKSHKFIETLSSDIVSLGHRGLRAKAVVASNGAAFPALPRCAFVTAFGLNSN